MENQKKEAIDKLTGFYLYESAVSEMKRQMAENPEGKYHITMLHFWNSEQYIEEYGSAFTLAIVGNLAMVLQYCYYGFGEQILFSRVQKDTFLAFIREEDAEKVERQAVLVYDELLRTYFGRNQELKPKLTLATYHMPDGPADVAEAMACVGNALEYGKSTDTPVVVFWDFMKREHDTVPCESDYSKLEGENLENYDKQFLSFAVSLLSASNDLDSSINMLIQRIAWRFGFDEVSISEFAGGQKTILTNQWLRGVGVLDDMNREVSFDNWTGFYSRFNQSGVAIVPDVEKEKHCEEKRSYFRKKGICSYIDILLYANERPIGYMSYCNRKKRELWDEETINSLVQLSKLTAVFVSLRLQKKKNKNRIDALSRDELTGLYQYPEFRRKVKRALDDYKEEKCYAFTYSDISNFSYLNENFGYEEGNKVLQEFARRIKDNGKKKVIVCRLEGDRFVAFSKRNSEEEIENSVRRVNDDFGNYLAEKYPQSDLHITSGIYFVRNPMQKIYRMIDSANHARKSYKNQHHNSVGIFSDDLAMQRKNVLDVVGNVHAAIRNGEIEAFLQPKFSMKDRRVQGAEALVRWRKKDGTYYYPSQFIPVLEDAGFIVDVDMCVYEQVLKSLARWKKEGKTLIPISVNFSRVHFRDERAYEKIVRLAREYGVDSRYIEIEITESTFAKDRDNLYRQMSALRDSGFKIDIDDFGTGYSSLNMLLFAPVDIVKVDKSFIDNYNSEEEREYINQIGNLILSAQKDIIFEGVETEEQSALLVGCGYDRAQGYLFSKPIPLKEFEEKYMKEASC